MPTIEQSGDGAEKLLFGFSLVRTRTMTECWLSSNKEQSLAAFEEVLNVVKVLAW